ncbi:Phosphodiest-domain-containing protein [Pseudovirgaria hyperparasitica]|uniref:Phosphodiest-domain-containing protein n=1 Tax=Pseudovirgaria hyperparasitica TaxID=470096 RepID=A0A6A6VTS1_9PEZI|nr:Phosphodiest-domain-containing protein [Pseudovirgaria hyperparasitica]KAF2754088.1 Phosphodiest-domain-containing protein [Pseudovirgaria hyperparasitica]
MLLSGIRRSGGLEKLFKDPNAPVAMKKTRKAKRRAQRKERALQGEDSELLYEMEEGVPSSTSSGSSRDPSILDRQRMQSLHGKKAGRKYRPCKWICIGLVIIVLFLILLFAAWAASSPPKVSAITFFSNGSSLFAPTTILISLDGFRADFLDRGLTPTLNKFVHDGISPRYMYPSFPSLTFPNHYTMVTGLHPESHGIVGNTFWDPYLMEEFWYTKPAQSMQPKWWGGEPLWETAERQGVRAAIHMWPGSEAHIGKFEPAYVDKYNGSEALSKKVQRILGLLDLPGPRDQGAKDDKPRPQLIAAYVPNVDSDGHKFGPNSTEIRKTIQSVDMMLENLFFGLEERNLTGLVNVVVVSDHGMATTDTERMIQLEDLVDTNEIEHIDGWPLFGLRPKDSTQVERMYNEIVAKTEHNPNIEVYLRETNMPKRYHFSKNNRIAPIWLIPKSGWAIAKKDEFDIAKAKEVGEVFRPRGLHGYDNMHPLMRAIFIARGPAFPHSPGSRVEPFQNIELYNIVCDSLGIQPLPNNGTLRLPLRPIGLHNETGAPGIERPNDPPHVDENLSSHKLPGSGNHENIEGHKIPSGIPVLPPTAQTTSIETHNDQQSDQSQTVHVFDSVKDFFDWLTDKVNSAKEWASDALHQGQNTSPTRE